MNNNKLLNQIRQEALYSYYWNVKGSSYPLMIKRYAPILKEDAFKSIAKHGEHVLGIDEIENRLGRNIKIEELYISPQAIPYVIFGSPMLTNSQEEEKALNYFLKLVRRAIKSEEIETIHKLYRYLKMYKSNALHEHEK